MKAHLRERNAKIKEIFDTLRDSETSVDDSLEKIAHAFHLQPEYVRQIVRGKYDGPEKGSPDRN